MSSYIQCKYSVAHKIIDLCKNISHGRRVTLMDMEEWGICLGACVLKESTTLADLFLHDTLDTESKAAVLSLIPQHLTIQYSDYHT